jgi:hypothetical protein
VKASAAFERGAGDIGNAEINSEKRILYVYEPIEGAGAVGPYYNRRSTHGAERLNRISQANTAIGNVDADNDIDDINNSDVTFKLRSDVVAADRIAGRGGADVPRGYDAGQRAVSGGTGAEEERGGKKKKNTTEDARIYKIIKRRYRRKKNNNIREHSK